LYACRESYFSAYLTLWFPLLIWWTPLCRMLQIMTRRFTLYAYFYTGQSTLSDYTKTLELTGNKAGQTANNLLFVTEQLEDSGSSFTKAKAAVIALASAGADLGGNYQAIASDIARLSDVAGVEVNKLAEIFGKITSDPEAGLKAMSEQYGHVTAAQLDYVHSLQEAGIYGHSRFCNTDFDDKLACLNLSGV
ncbi:phage tail length tape measure family protein, partial [Klebsiella pneumoniae]|uniref:phage tail length tape measure family protein n=1 Tax=Klebsiella pneumoniae TaxID=573 RepID=UPI003D955DBD